MSPRSAVSPKPKVAKEAAKPSVAAAAKPKIAEQSKVIRKLSYLYATGKRKSAVARVRLYPKETNVKFLVNDKDYRQYFPYFEWQQRILAPLKLLGLEGKYHISIKVQGGGMQGQADSIRHGLARVLLLMDEKFRKTLRGNGLLTRDSRVKERKKPGLKRARRAPQWAKR